MPRQHEHSTDTPGRRRIVRVKATASDLGTSSRTLKRWEDKGLFPLRVKFGPNSVGYFADEVEAWKAAQARTAARAESGPRDARGRFLADEPQDTEPAGR